MDRILPNFVYILLWTKSRLELLTIIFHKIVIELRPLTDVRISFPLNILRTNGQNLTKFCIHIHIDGINIGRNSSMSVFANL